ncbi:MAG TPA: hypothetical protein VF188_08060 [Longimicrobiales bacterium]
MYRPGNLYVGREGDRLFAVYAGGGVGFVTVRGTRLTVEHVERVYAPLTLARDAEMEQLRAELADVHHDLKPQYCRDCLVELFDEEPDGEEAPDAG